MRANHVSVSGPFQAVPQASCAVASKVSPSSGKVPTANAASRVRSVGPALLPHAAGSRRRRACGSCRGAVSSSVQQAVYSANAQRQAEATAHPGSQRPATNSGRLAVSAIAAREPSCEPCGAIAAPRANATLSHASRPNI